MNERLWIWGPKNEGEGVYFLMRENGEVIASHLCSHVSFAAGDLEARRPERQAKWRAEFGEYTVTLASDETTPSRDDLLAANKRLAPPDHDVDEVPYAAFRRWQGEA